MVQPVRPTPSDGIPEVTGADVDAAAARLAGAVVATPMTQSSTLGEVTGADVYVKFENLQFTGSFKDRGALNFLLQLHPDRARRGVVAMSAGNHAQGVAHHAARLGIPATIVMPAGTPMVKVARTEGHGARVVLEGRTVDEARARAEALAADEGLTLVHPYDDPAVIAGQGTVAVEMLDEVGDLDVLVAPVGGGGLLAGMAVAARARRSDLELVGVQTDRYPSMVAALAPAGAAPPVPGGTTVADGIAVTTPGRITSALLARCGVDMTTVAESTIERAIALLIDIEKTVAEGAGAVPLAALLEHPERFAGRRVGLVLSGGNIDPRLLSVVTLRGLVREGRLCRLGVETADLPGELADVAARLADAGANVVEVEHDRLGVGRGARHVGLEFLVDTLDEAHIARIVASLESAGYPVRRLDP